MVNFTTLFGFLRIYTFENTQTPSNDITIYISTVTLSPELWHKDLQLSHSLTT